MKRTHQDFLRDILDAIDHALAFVRGVSLEDFQANVEKQFAVVRALEIMGEAARNIPPDIQAKYSHLPWKEMIGMRNVVAHNYFGVDEVVIWRTVHEDLPPLREAVHKIITNEKFGDDLE